MSVGPDKKAVFGLYVDPGTRSAGSALFMGEHLKRANLFKRPANAPTGPKESRKWAIKLGHQVVERALLDMSELAPRQEWLVRVVVEFQQVYTKGKARTKNPKDVLVLTLQSGGIIMSMQRWLGEGVTSWDLREPAQWKGNVKEDLKKERTQKVCTSEEYLCFEHLGRAKNNSDVWVAVGIGFGDVGRHYGA